MHPHKFAQPQPRERPIAKITPTPEDSQRTTPSRQVRHKSHGPMCETCACVLRQRGNALNHPFALLCVTCERGTGKSAPMQSKTRGDGGASRSLVWRACLCVKFSRHPASTRPTPSGSDNVNVVCTRILYECPPPPNPPPSQTKWCRTK